MPTNLQENRDSRPIKKLRKHLNARALFKTIYHRFKKIPDFRADNKIDISLPDALMSAFAMFSLKDPSLLMFDKRRENDIERKNLESTYGINTVPSDSRMREICDEIDPKKYLSATYVDVFRSLQRGKALEPMVFYNGCYLLNLDGTGFFSSKKLSAPFCMQKVNKKTGEITYYLQMLGAAIVHPDFKEVIPLCPEMIIKQDGESKNDCERNAAKRFFENLRKAHPHLKLIVNEDALSPNAPHIRDLEKYNLHYILGVKPGDHAFLFNYIGAAAQEGRTIEFDMQDEKKPNLVHCFRILNKVPLNRSNQDMLVNFIEYWEIDRSGENEMVTYHNTWRTDFVLTKENSYTIMLGGRKRWKIENETFNTLKNQGYHFEHNYGLGKKHLAEVFALLTVLAFLIDQVQQLCCCLFQAAWKKLGSKKALWEAIRAYFKSFLVQSMEEIYEALIYGIKQQPLSDLINDTS